MFILHEVLLIAVRGLLVGGECFYDIEDFAAEHEGWLRGFLLRPGGVPLNSIFQTLCPHAVAECFARWTQGVRQRLGSGRAEVTIDGKSPRTRTHPPPSAPQ